jgi:predicted transcriptional regulator
MSMTLRLTDDQDRILTELARAQGISKNEAALRAIAAEHRRTDRQQEIRRLTADAIEEYGPLLDRLAQ